MSWIKHRSWSGVESETDYLVVVQAIRNKVSMRLKFGQIIDHCRREIDLIKNVCLYFIKWPANIKDHKFARISYKFSDPSFH